MSEVPSGYLIDKAKKAFDQAELESKKPLLDAQAEIDKALADGLASDDSGLPMSVEVDEPSALEVADHQVDVTLTDLEKTLTERQLKFAWALAKARCTGKVSLTQCAIDAGYAESNAAKAGSDMARNPKIARVVAERMPMEMKMRAVKERGPDYVIEKMVVLVERAMQERPVIDRNGNVTGHFVFDGALAKSGLDSLANWMGMTKSKLEMTGADGEAIKVESKNVEVPVFDLAARIRAASAAKAIEVTPKDQS